MHEEGKEFLEYGEVVLAHYLTGFSSPRQADLISVP